LFIAAANGHKDVAGLLLANKAEVDIRDSTGVTPLYAAAADGHTDVVALLLANKAEVNATTNSGATPLQIALANGHKETAELLRANGADVDIKSNNPDAAELLRRRPVANAQTSDQGAGTHTSIGLGCQQQYTQEKPAATKLDSDFLLAIRKGDAKKIDALAGRGANVNANGAVIDVEDVRAVAGGFSYRLKSTALTGPSQPMLTAISSARPEAVRALLALGADVKGDFFLDAQTCFPLQAVDIMAEGNASISYGPFRLRAVDGVVTSSLFPTSARKTTYLRVAEQLFAAAQNAGSRRRLEQIMDLLRQHGGHE
jgi:hypothetical protein